MPEGDVVFLAADVLHTALAGKVLTRSDFRVPRYATVDLSGHTVTGVVSYGKHLFIRTETVSVHSHLKMEGSWRIFHFGQRWTKPRVTARVVLAANEVEAVGFSLGTVTVLGRSEEHTVTDSLGPDLLGPGWNPAEAVRRLEQDPQRPIGTALLDQQNLAGIGNIYRNEVCFLRRVHPATPVGELPDMFALVNEANRVLRKAVRQPPWRPLVYGKDRRPCPRCGTNVRVDMLGETVPAGDRTSHRERGIYFCPHCQPPPR